MWTGSEDLSLPMTKFPGIYPAEVVDNDYKTDPASGLVKVRVWPMMKAIEEDALPWAAPAFGLFEGGKAGVGAFTVPDVNSRVYVFFAAGDVLSPVYFAACPGQTDGPAGRSVTKKMWKSRSGHQIEIEDDSGSEMIKVTHKDGASIELDSSGSVKLVDGSAELEIDSSGNITITANGGAVVDIQSGGNILVTAKGGSEVQIGAGGSVQALLNAAAATLFNSHTHGPGTFTAGGNPVIGLSAAPGTPMGSTEQTAETKAS